MKQGHYQGEIAEEVSCASGGDGKDLLPATMDEGIGYCGK